MWRRSQTEEERLHSGWLLLAKQALFSNRIIARKEAPQGAVLGDSFYGGEESLFQAL